MLDPIRTPHEDCDPAADARRLLRRWLGTPDADVLREIDALGRQAIAASTHACARLGRGVGASQTAEQGLRHLEAMARAIDAPAPASRPSFFAREPAPPPPPSIETLVAQLDRERDALSRSLLGLDTDRTRLRAAADGLTRALELIRACTDAVEAAVREMALDRPDRARFLADVAAVRLLSREGDIAIQAVVTDQAILMLGVIADSQDALAQALVRARDISIAALRTAVAAREAMATSASLGAQARALDQTAAAVESLAAARPAVRRALDDAVVQARRTLAAQEIAP